MALTRIGIFYDGNYFLHVSNYYNYDHPQRRRLSIAGLHRFVQAEVERVEALPEGTAKIVDSHYFRARLSATDAQQRGNTLYYDRVFDDILMSCGVNTHYSAIRNRDGRRQETGIDVWMALECFEMAMLRKLDVIVLIASDSDYVPLVRKLNGLGCRVMVLGWDFEFVSDNGTETVTRTSQDLLEEASYPMQMDHLIDYPPKGQEGLIDGLFVSSPSKPREQPEEDDDELYEFEQPEEGEVGDLLEGEIFSLKAGYGFIKYPPSNLFFHYSNVRDTDFNDLQVGDVVEYTLAHNKEGKLVATEVERVHAPADYQDEE